MSRLGNRISVDRCFLLAVAVLTVWSAAAPTAPAQDTGAPPWGEFLRRFGRDRLLKPPFHMAEETTPKGLASKIRARELDIPNRKKAIRYLAERDCRVFPEAKEMLILAMQEDKWEEIRFEAARGLRDMLQRHSCNPAAANGGNGSNGSNGSNGNCQYCQSPNCPNCQNAECQDCQTQQQPTSWWGRARESVSGERSRRIRGPRESGPDFGELPCHCRSCCDADTLQALAKTAYELQEDGCPFEPSKRVREMAVEAIAACGIPCHYSPYYAVPEEEGPPPLLEGEGILDENGERTAPVPMESDAPAPPIDAALLPVTQASLQSVRVEPTPIARLNGLCIVSLKSGRQVAGQDSLQSVHKGRVYTFASSSCKSQFDSDPEAYAVAFGGCDPVHFVQTRQAVEGRYLVSHSGRLLMFSTKDNISRFQADPARYLPQSVDQVAAVR